MYWLQLHPLLLLTSDYKQTTATQSIQLASGTSSTLIYLNSVNFSSFNSFKYYPSTTLQISTMQNIFFFQQHQPAFDRPK